MSKRVLLIAATTGYQTRIFADEARRMGLDLVLATDRCHVLENPWKDDAIAIRFDDPSPGIEALAELGPFDGIAAVGDQPAFVAALAAARLGLPFSTPSAVLASKNKFMARERFRQAGLLTPEYRFTSDPDQVTYPCVLKPLTLSASRGVIRANDPAEFNKAFARIKKLLGPEPGASGPRTAGLRPVAGVSIKSTAGDAQTFFANVLVEDFIPGREYALEGLATGGNLQVLALFDKPDPLDGPFFEETIYITPSREPIAAQRAIFDTAQRAITALGLTRGPVHAEMRVNQQGVWMLEVAARPIGGLCSRVLRFDPDISLEEVILRHALGEDVTGVRLVPGAHGVMMIPIPRAGVYAGVEGLEKARAVPGIEDVVITAKEGQTLAPLPEGASYLGFIFARGESPNAADRALRESHACLKLHLSGVLPIVR